MEQNMDLHQVAEMQDALEACEDLRIVLSRLKRLGLLTSEENGSVGRNIASITEMLEAKLPDDDSET
jgi:hypothetical protein